MYHVLYISLLNRGEKLLPVWGLYHNYVCGKEVAMLLYCTITLCMYILGYF
jgi:hypothetical protein